MNDVSEIAKEAKAEAFSDSNQFVATGERWLRDLGIISDLTHNAFILTLHTTIPHLRDLEYLVDQEKLVLELHLKFGWLRKIFLRKGKVIKEAQRLAGNYFKDYEVKVIIESI